MSILYIFVFMVTMHKGICAAENVNLQYGQLVRTFIDTKVNDNTKKQFTDMAHMLLDGGESLHGFIQKLYHTMALDVLDSFKEKSIYKPLKEKIDTIFVIQPFPMYSYEWSRSDGIGFFQDDKRDIYNSILQSLQDKISQYLNFFPMHNSVCSNQRKIKISLKHDFRNEHVTLLPTKASVFHPLAVERTIVPDIYSSQEKFDMYIKSMWNIDQKIYQYIFIQELSKITFNYYGYLDDIKNIIDVHDNAVANNKYELLENLSGILQAYTDTLNLFLCDANVIPDTIKTGLRCINQYSCYNQRYPFIEAVVDIQRESLRKWSLVVEAWVENKKRADKPFKMLANILK